MKKFLKENYILILILLLGFILRFNGDLFVQGYMFDELAMVSVAKTNFPIEIFKTISKLDYHAPLYYIIAHFFTYFKNEYLYLRLLNLIFSIFNIFIFYKIGKLLNSKRLGYFLALALAVSHIQIATVSFVKFYCLCFLLFSISVCYLIKIIKKNKGYFTFGISNLFFILSATLGGFIVFFEYLVLFFTSKEKKKLANSFLIAFLGFILYLPILISQTINSFNNILSPHGNYVNFSILSAFNFLNDYFSPLINFCCNTETISACGVLLDVISKPNLFSIMFLSFYSIIPVVLALFLIFKTVKNNKISKILFMVSILIFCFYIILSKLDIVGFIPIYIYPVGLILIILTFTSIEEIKNKKIKYFILIYLILSQLTITNYYPIEKRNIDKAKIYQVFDVYFKEHNIKPTPIISTNGARFLKYYYNDKNIIDFDNEKMGATNGREFFELIFSKENSKIVNKYNIRKIISPYILNNKIDRDFEEYFNKNVLDKVKKNETIVFAFNADENPFISTKNEMIEVLNNPNYNPHLTVSNIKEGLNPNPAIDSGDISEVIMSFGYYNLINLLEKNFKRTKVEQYFYMPNQIYEKQAETSSNRQSTMFLAQNARFCWIFVTYQKQ